MTAEKSMPEGLEESRTHAHRSTEQVSMETTRVLVSELGRLKRIEATARELVTTGMSLRYTEGPALSVIEKADKSDPHYRLCELLDETRGRRKHG